MAFLMTVAERFKTKYSLSKFVPSTDQALFCVLCYLEYLSVILITSMYE